MPAQRRYETLDALRGVAALAVVAYHLGQMKLAPELVPHGHLAVDFFFVLSGFVVAHAYEAGLRGPLTFGSFALRRTIRLYPLAILGVVVGFALLMLKWHSFPEKVDSLPRILVSGALNGLLLPTPFGGDASHHELFPGDSPLWTLFFEFAANLAWAAWAPRMRTGTLLVVVAIAGFAVAALSWQAGTANLGYDVATAPAGAARVCFGFLLGVVLFRLLGDAEWIGRLRSDRMGAAILGILLLAVLAMPQAASVSAYAAWDIAAILVLLPALVVAGIAQGQGGRFGDLLGELSYPVYVLHFPVVVLASGLRQTVLHNVPVLAIAATAALTAVVGALLASRLYDRPVRKWLSRVARRGPRTHQVGAAPLNREQL
jgi:peptidoglycan/LPS O-acetylase OafA/YrhL